MPIKQIIHRHIGGLENYSKDSNVWIYIHRHIGGLEIDNASNKNK